VRDPRAIDTTPHPDFRHYSTGNFAEVAPARWSIMSWSLVGDPVERGLRAFTLRLSPGARWVTGSHYVFVGYFSCRPYHNLSALCRLAREMPGVTEQDVTQAYFENVPAPEREVGAYVNVLQRLLALPRMAREFHRLRPRLALLEAEVALCEEQVSTALATGSLIALGAAMERALRVLDSAWDVHYSTTSSLVPATALQRAFGKRVFGQWDELEPLVNTPAELPWARLFDGAVDDAVQESGFLKFPFYEVGDDHEPWRSYARSFTPRPPRDLMAPEQSDIADVIWRMQPTRRSKGVQSLSRAVSDALAAREESKALAMRALHVFRQALPSLGAEANVADSWSYLRIGELLSPSHRTALVELADRRREECAHALGEEVPDQLIASSPGMSEDSPRRWSGGRPERKASGVSPGLASGIVVTLEDGPLNGELEHKEAILVCESADAGIQAMLPHLAGLITLRGSMLSHISTLAREYGVPTVVNHPLAETLRAGQQVVLNGSTGEVEVIA
jgi:phosphohistidine swiveling domain-containing protein